MLERSGTPAAVALAFPAPPGSGAVLEVAPGILWIRFAMPFRLDHVNIYLVEDGDGWAVIDTGLGDAPTREAWEALLAGPLSGRPLTRIIATHHHPDHVGSAGWLGRRFDLPLAMSATEYLTSLNLHLDPGALEAETYRRFYVENGLAADVTDEVVTQGHRYLKLTTGLPPSYHRLVAQDVLRIGGRVFEVLTGGGHAPEQVMLHCADDQLFFSADQVLARISPNISVSAVDPEGDPLGIYLRSLAELKQIVPNDVLVLPGHDVPFHGLHRRIDELTRHHRERCDAIAEACRAAPRSVAEIVPTIFHRPLDPHQMSFAFSEALAHVNYMLRSGELEWAQESGAVRRVVVRHAGGSVDRPRPTITTAGMAGGAGARTADRSGGLG